MSIAGRGNMPFYEQNLSKPTRVILRFIVVCCWQIYAVISRANDQQEVQEYAELVGPVVSSRMLLFRSG